MPTNLLILPLLAGFCFVHLCHAFRFRAQRLHGYRLLLESAATGAILLLLSRIVVVGIKMSPYGDLIGNAWFSFAPVPWLGTAAGSVVIGVALAMLDNHRPKSCLGQFVEETLRRHRMFRPIRRTGKVLRRVKQINLRQALHSEITKHGSALTRLLHYADRNECWSCIIASCMRTAPLMRAISF